jgi:hypothetical protein
MSDKKITQLTALTSLAAADLFVVVDDVAGTPVSKKIAASDIATYIGQSLADSADIVLSAAVFS